MPAGCSTPYCIPFEECRGDMVETIGGKNASLGELVEAGSPVPPGFAVTTAFYQEFLRANELGPLIDSETASIGGADEETIESIADTIQSAIREASFTEELEQPVAESWHALADRADVDSFSVAVRSSATAEDLPDASFAGQHDTYLHVTGIDGVLDRIRDCMASLYTARAITYREENGIPQTSVHISVGVQRLVNAETSGVMFTLNPSNGDRSKVRIEANWGLGEAVVNGSVTPDSYLVDKPTYTVVERDIATKTEMVVPAASGIDTVSVPEEKRNESCLDSDDIETLTEIGKRLERHFETPQDIEWVVEEETGKVFVVQSRPETTWN